MIRIGICDDDANFAREFPKDIEKYFYKYSCIQDEIKCICYSNAQEAIDKFWEDSIHVYFLDIEYGEQSGMDVARRLEKIRQDLGFVYVTNYEHYASKAFVCRPLGFVRKKYIEDDMGMVMASVGEYLEKDRRVLTFKNNTKEVPIRLGNVQYVQIYDHTLVIALTNQKLELRDKLSRVEKMLCEQGFVKISRSCKVYYTDNIILNYLLNQKIEVRQKKDIHIKYIINGMIDGIKDIDLHCIVSNLLDNAIEATQNLDNRNIAFSIFGNPYSIYIEVSNTVAENVLQCNPELQSSKTEGNHGYGIKNVRASVEKYQGEVRYRQKLKGYLTCEVVLMKKFTTEMGNSRQDN